MFDTKKFGGYLSRIRKNADMTQSELADRLNLTRQAISKYETGDSFPDISILVLIAEIYDITLDELINAGEPSKSEAKILGSIAVGDDTVVAESISDVMGLAPLLKPSVLNQLSTGLEKQGIDISNVVTLAEYLSDETVVELLCKSNFDTINAELFEKLIPFLDQKNKETIFEKILNGQMDWHFIEFMLPYAEYMISQIEAATIEGALPKEVLRVVHDYIFREKK